MFEQFACFLQIVSKCHLLFLCETRTLSAVCPPNVFIISLAGCLLFLQLKEMAPFVELSYIFKADVNPKLKGKRGFEMTQREKWKAEQLCLCFLSNICSMDQWRNIWRCSEVFLVEDKLDVSLRVRQTLFLQRFTELRRSTQEHPHFAPENTSKLKVRKRVLLVLPHSLFIIFRWSSPWMLRSDAGELVVPVWFPVKSLLFESGDRIILRLVVDTEMSCLVEEETEKIL